MRVLLLGASGFVGTHLSAALRGRGDEVIAASLRDPSACARSAAQCDAIVNLAGESISQRWSAGVKRRIEESRTAEPRRLLELLSNAERRAKVYVSASAVGYYGTSETETFVESSAPGDDFLARVCQAWEREAHAASQLGMRVAIVRTGVALGTSGGALKKLLPPFRIGAGGVVGSGRQWFSWIHIEDLIGIYLMAIDRIEGPVNATAPNPATNADFARELGEAIHRPALLPVPAFALRALLGEGADIVLRGQRVLPQRTQELGYRFEFERLKDALANLL